ncbi:hypothetical protein GQ457_05G017720 [Hibiscus cannabinus]
MSFSLKNARATFQRLINKVFRNYIWRSMDAYLDDMIVKSMSMEQHVKDLVEVSQVLRQYNMRLNPVKCPFEVNTRMFLGFLTSEREIKANLEKIVVFL